MIRFARQKTVFVFCFAATACGAKTVAPPLPPLGEVVVSLDTDAPVPEFVGRLRIDVFDQKGQWLESRDIARTDAADWPASFSLYTLDEAKPRTVLVRARAYLEGRLRNYRGERFEERLPHVEPKVASTLSELCDNPPKLVLGQELTLRRGPITVTDYVPENPPPMAPVGWTPQCAKPIVGGAIAARLDISEAGEYRIETTEIRPAAIDGGDVNLFIRTSCSDRMSQIACADDLVPGKSSSFDGDYVARIVTHLEPGSYTVMAGGYVAAPAEITLKAALAAKWDEATDAPPGEPPVAGQPRLVSDGTDVTPKEEPQPLVTIDRLALLTLVPGQKRLATIVLRTACAGLMSRLSRAGSDAAPVLAEAETCVEKDAREKLSEEALVPFAELPSKSVAGTFPLGQACPEAGARSGAICIPSGTFVLGSPEGVTPLVGSSAPERLAVMDRFWLDRTEVTVRRWRAALARGFKSPNATPVENGEHVVKSSEGTAYALDKTSKQNFLRRCTFSASAAPMGESREDFPLNCVDWTAARAFCQFEEGDLPTEAQFEYAATRAGRLFETRFPWGNQTEAPRCDQAVFGKWDSVLTGAVASTICAAVGFGAVAVTDPVAQKDATRLGVMGLSGNLMEWALDGFEAFESPCWNGASLRNPACREENAPVRPLRGNSWRGSPEDLPGWQRDFNGPVGFVDFSQGAGSSDVGVGHDGVGFRCAYDKEPK